METIVKNKIVRKRKLEEGRRSHQGQCMCHFYIRWGMTFATDVLLYTGVSYIDPLAEGFCDQISKSNLRFRMVENDRKIYEIIISG